MSTVAAILFVAWANHDPVMGFDTPGAITSQPVASLEACMPMAAAVNARNDDPSQRYRTRWIAFCVPVTSTSQE